MITIDREVAVDFALAKNDYQRIEQEKIEQNLSVNNHAEGQDTATNMNVNSKADIHENLSKEEFDDKLRNRSTDDEDDEDEDDDFDEKETPKGSNEKDYESRDDVDISGTSIISGASDFVDESSRRNEWDTADGKTLFFEYVSLLLFLMVFVVFSHMTGNGGFSSMIVFLMILFSTRYSL